MTPSLIYTAWRSYMDATRNGRKRPADVPLDQQTDAWGIKVINVEIKHVDLDESMVRAIAKQAEALQLRYLQTLTEIVGERSNTIVFPLPMDLIAHLIDKRRPD